MNINIKIANKMLIDKINENDMFKLYYTDDTFNEWYNFIKGNCKIPILLDENMEFEKTGHVNSDHIIGFVNSFNEYHDMFSNYTTGVNIIDNKNSEDILYALLCPDMSDNIFILLYPKKRNKYFISVGEIEFLDDFTCGVLVDRNLKPYKLNDLLTKRMQSRSEKEKLKKSNKRTDYISWDEYFMGIAKLSALRSKDPKTQVGCCIVKDNKILSIGYNGMPNNCSDDKFPWNREDADPLNIKYLYVVHAELNAILNYKGESLEGSTIYVTLFPCNECTKAIIQSGIKNIVYLEERDSIETQASKRMLQSAGVNYTKYKPSNKTLNIDV